MQQTSVENNTEGSIKIVTGMVVLLPFKYTNLQKRKKRPAIVVSSVNYCMSKQEVICAMVSTRAASDKYDVTLKRWKEAGLCKPSIVRVGNLQTVDNSILTPCGYLTTEDMQRVSKILANILFLKTK